MSAWKLTVRTAGLPDQDTGRGSTLDLFLGDVAYFVLKLWILTSPCEPCSDLSACVNSLKPSPTTRVRRVAVLPERCRPGRGRRWCLRLRLAAIALLVPGSLHGLAFTGCRALTWLRLIVTAAWVCQVR